jgi:hypothetical protein
MQLFDLDAIAASADCVYIRTWSACCHILIPCCHEARSCSKLWCDGLSGAVIQLAFVSLVVIIVILFPDRFVQLVGWRWSPVAYTCRTDPML